MACLDFPHARSWRIFGCTSRKLRLPVEMFSEVNSFMLDIFGTFHPLLQWALDQKHTLHYYTDAFANTWPMQHKAVVHTGITIYSTKHLKLVITDIHYDRLYFTQPACIKLIKKTVNKCMLQKIDILNKYCSFLNNFFYWPQIFEQYCLQEVQHIGSAI